VHKSGEPPAERKKYKPTREIAPTLIPNRAIFCFFLMRTIAPQIIDKALSIAPHRVNTVTTSHTRKSAKGDKTVTAMPQRERREKELRIVVQGTTRDLVDDDDCGGCIIGVCFC
jgi:hypothetical protein